MIYMIIIALLTVSKGCPQNGEVSKDGFCYYLNSTCPPTLTLPIHREMEFSLIAAIKKRASIPKGTVCVSVDDDFFDLLIKEKSPTFLKQLRDLGSAFFEKNVDKRDSVYLEFKIKDASKSAKIKISNPSDPVNYLVLIEIISSGNAFPVRNLKLSSVHKGVLETATFPFQSQNGDYFQFEITFTETHVEIDDRLKNAKIGTLQLGSGDGRVLSVDNLDVWQIEHVLRRCKAGGHWKIDSEWQSSFDVEMEREIYLKYAMNARNSLKKIESKQADLALRKVMFHLMGDFDLHIFLRQFQASSENMLDYNLKDGTYGTMGTCYKNLRESGDQSLGKSNGYTIEIEAKKSDLHILIQSSDSKKQFKQFSSLCRFKNACPIYNDVGDCVIYSSSIELHIGQTSQVFGFRTIPIRPKPIAKYCFSDLVGYRQPITRIPYNRGCSDKDPEMVCKIREPVTIRQDYLGDLNILVTEDVVEQFQPLRRPSGWMEILKKNIGMVSTLIACTVVSTIFTFLNCLCYFKI